MIVCAIGVRRFELFPLLKVVLKEIVASIVISCVVRLKFWSSALLQVILCVLNLKYTLRSVLLL
jgi:hypothetical protein